MTAPPLAEETPFGRRYRNFRTGETAVSVTSVLKMVAKPEVEAWKLRMAAGFANENWDEMADWHPFQRKEAMLAAHEDYTGERARIGDLVHETVERLIKGVPTEIPKEIAGHIGQFSKFVMAKRPRWIEAEVTVWNRTLGYAGTADAIAEIDGETWMLDWKSGKGVYPEYGMQLAAMENAEFIIRPDCTEEPIPQIDHLCIFHLRPRSHRLVPILERQSCFRAFCAALELHNWKHETAEGVLGVAA